MFLPNSRNIQQVQPSNDGSIFQNDVLLNGASLGDSAGYIYYMIWGLVSTIITMMVGGM